MTVWGFIFLLMTMAQFVGVPLLAQQTPFRILAFYSDRAEPDHVDFARDALKFLKSRAVPEGFIFESTTHWEDLNDERLNTCQVVIWLNESPTNPNQRRAFE